MNYVEVSLTRSEFMEAAFAGCGRVTNVVFDNLKTFRGTENPAKWEQHVSGALAEKAVAKLLNLYWPGCSDKNAPADVGKDVEVKSTPLHRNNLLVPVDQCKPGSRYYLITGSYNDYRVHGWRWGWECALCPVVNHQGRGNAYRIPQDRLRAVSEQPDYSQSAGASAA